ncbi:hypothetical protein B1A_21733, partial [mine drainage metagenome]
VLREAAAAPVLSNSVPQTPPPASAPAAAAPAPRPAPKVSTAPAVSAAAPVIHVHTDVYDLEISTEGGTLVKVDLLHYAKVQGSKARVELESTDPAREYLLQTGLTGPSGADYPTQAAR